MLRRFRVDNFKSLINVVFEPGLVNLLTGKNNSGKTSLCQALSFLRFTARTPIIEAALLAAGEPWNLPNAYLNKDTISFECHCDIEEDGETLQFVYSLQVKAAVAPHIGPAAREFSVELETLTVAGGKFKSETILLANDKGQVRLFNERRFDHQSEDHYEETNAPSNASMLSRIYDPQQNRTANVFRNYLANWLYYDLEPAKLRSGEAKTQGFVLNQDGSNLANVLYLLKTVDERRYRHLVNIVREVEPKLDGINFTPPTQESIFMSITDAQDKRFGPSSISSGTMLFMALAFVIATWPLIAEALNQPGPLIIIEEPENGIYVSYLKKLMELVEPTGKHDPQFIFTSHSPYFIDLFDKYPDNIFVMRSDKTHAEIIKPNSDKIHNILDSFSLGEAHFRELLA